MQVFITPFMIVHTLESENKSCEIKTFPLAVIRTDGKCNANLDKTLNVLHDMPCMHTFQQISQITHMRIA
jgi:hypothetical protein